MMTRRTIAAVSYLNTIPFIYGIEHADSPLRAELLLCPPADCARNIASGKADIALIPAEAARTIPDVDIVTDYCIGASGPVRSVTLLSNDPLEKIESVYLDPHSLTSVKLGRILARELWDIAPRWIPLDDYEILAKPPSRSAFILIGDKVFDRENDFAYNTDLASEWQKMTGLPFVFAVWVARKGIPPQEIELLNRALGFGIGHIPQAIEQYGYSHLEYAADYLTRNIDFKFNAPKREALELFWKKGAAI